jgi:integrase
MPKQAKDKRDGIFRRKGRTGLYAEWVDGTGRRVSRKLTATTMKEAVTELVLKKKQAEKIRNGEAMPVTEDSFAVFVRQFLKYQQRRISPEVVRDKISAQEYERQRGIVENHLLPHFGQMRPALVRKVHVIVYIHKRTGVISDGTIIKEVNTLKHIFSYALELEKIAASPAAKVKMPKAPDGRNRWLNVEEWHRLFAACALYEADQSTASRIGLLNKKRALEGLAAIVPIKQKPLPAEEQWLQQAAALAISLGTRRGELLHVQLPDIDLDLRKILLRRTKNGRPRLAFINDAAMIVLDVMQVVRGRGAETSGRCSSASPGRS